MLIVTVLRYMQNHLSNIVEQSTWVNMEERERERNSCYCALLVYIFWQGRLVEWLLKILYKTIWNMIWMKRHENIVFTVQTMAHTYTYDWTWFDISHWAKHKIIVSSVQWFLTMWIHRKYLMSYSMEWVSK